jgi:EAL domain-containing protein (putative c-di-GMP-specific phosphodiesterase class I)
MVTLSAETPPSEYDLSALLEQKSAAAFYQPIVSIKKKAVIGLESTGRGIDPKDRQLIEPEALQRVSDQEEKGLDLDRLFRAKGLEGFKEIQAKIPGLLLFLGVDSSVLTRKVVGSGHLLDSVRALGLDPNCLILELSRAEGEDERALREFVDRYRNEEFLIGLKDVDTSRGALDRVLHLGPDVIKLEPSLTLGLSKDPYKRDSFRTLVAMGHKMGSLLVANGVENEEDALAALELGTDMLQGSYFSKPQRTETSTTLGLKARIVFVASRFKRQLTEKMVKDKDRKARYERIATEVFRGLAAEEPQTLETKFSGCLRAFPQLECLYLLDQDGVQVTETICNFRKVAERKKFLFQPAPKGTDHSLKDYYYSLVYNGLEKYFTEPYVSLASGNLCVTASWSLGKSHILCMDIDVTRI